jgi:hypothetical protein
VSEEPDTHIEPDGPDPGKPIEEGLPKPEGPDVGKHEEKGAPPGERLDDVLREKRD